MNSGDKPPEKTLVDKGFDLDKRVNHLLIAGGLGVAAVGAVIAAPTVAIFGAAVAGGSVAGLAINERLERSYRKHQAKKLGNKVTKDHFALAA